LLLFTSDDESSLEHRLELKVLFLVSELAIWIDRLAQAVEERLVLEARLLPRPRCLVIYPCQRMIARSKGDSWWGMSGEVDTDIQRQILKSLREFYPIKVDDIVLIAAVQKNVKDASVEQIGKDIALMKEKGWIEETIVKAPFGKAETYRYKITSSGIEHLQQLEEKEVRVALPAKEIESRLVETYDRIKADMEQMRLNLENSQKTLEKEMTDVRGRIADHDTVIRTYFVRVIETFGVFVGIFAVVVVSMLSGISTAADAIKAGGDPTIFFLYIIGIAVTIAVVILSLLYGIRKLILIPPKSNE